MATAKTLATEVAAIDVELKTKNTVKREYKNPSEATLAKEVHDHYNAAGDRVHETTVGDQITVTVRHGA